MIAKKRIERYCCGDISQIENYNDAINDKNKIWDCHHRLETHDSDGKRRMIDLKVEELIALGVYYERPSNELIFLTKSEHHSIHIEHNFEEMCKKAGEKSKTPEVRLKNSIANSGEKNGFYGKHYNDETRKKLSEMRKGKKWFTNGKKNICCKECPKGFRLGYTDLSGLKRKVINNLAEKRKGKHLYNNGIISVYADKCPDGFVAGGIKKVGGVSNADC